VIYLPKPEWNIRIYCTRSKSAHSLRKSKSRNQLESRWLATCSHAGFLTLFLFRPWRWKRYVTLKSLLFFQRNTRCYISQYRTLQLKKGVLIIVGWKPLRTQKGGSDGLLLQKELPEIKLFKNHCIISWMETWLTIYPLRINHSHRQYECSLFMIPRVVWGTKILCVDYITSNHRTTSFTVPLLDTISLHVSAYLTGHLQVYRSLQFRSLVHNTCTPEDGQLGRPKHVVK
jgi:hypothetical protein